MEEVSVDHRREEVRGRADGVDVTREVEVEILHGDDLRQATACAASLDAEDRAHGRLAQAHDGAALASRKAVDEADRDCRLALAEAGVGVIPVTATSRPGAASRRRSIAGSGTLALSRP